MDAHLRSERNPNVKVDQESKNDAVAVGCNCKTIRIVRNFIYGRWVRSRELLVPLTTTDDAVDGSARRQHGKATPPIPPVLATCSHANFSMQVQILLLGDMGSLGYRIIISFEPLIYLS